MAHATSENTSAAALDLGWADLAGSRWTEARACFERAAAAKETPEAHEGLSWAAWWLDDADVVFAACDRAYRLYKQRGDGPAAARMATWLACDELDFHGAFAVASGWLGRARRLLGELEPGPEHGWLAFFEGYIASGAGDSDRAIELAVEAAAIGRRLEVPDLEMLGLALEGATLVACAHVDEGMRRLDDATAAALEGEAHVAIAGAWACCFLVTACSAVRDYERASEWCDRIAEFAERHGSRYMLAFCRAEYGGVHLWRGSWRAAEEVLEASVEDFSRSRPAMVGGPLAALAECGGDMDVPRKLCACSDRPARRHRHSFARRGLRSTADRRCARSSWSSGCFASCRSIAIWIGRRPWSCWSARGPLEESSTRRTLRWNRFA